MENTRHTFAEVEYDRGLIERSLFYGGYDLSKIDIDMISIAPMARFAVSSKEKPLLYTFGLQCCIGLLGCSGSLGFLAHISTELIDDSDYEVDEKLNPIRLKRIDDLYNHIIKNKELITEPIKISLVIGTNPIKEDSKAKVLILEAINDLIFKLKALGISVYYDGEFYQSSFIFDTTNNKFILPDKKVKL